MKTKIKTISLPVELVKKIEKYQEKHLHSTFTNALLDILKQFFKIN